MVHLCFSVVMAQCTLFSVWGKDSEDTDDSCDSEVGEPVPKMKKQTRNFQAHF